MLPLLLSLLGASGALYIFLRRYWPNFYLDWLYTRVSKQVGQAPMKNLMAQKFLVDIFEDHVRTAPDRCMLIYGNKKYSYKYMDQKANQLARAMVEIGVTPGSAVAMIIYNEPAFVYTYLGLMKIGVEIATINFNLRNKSLAHCIRVCGAKTLLVGQGDALVQAVADIHDDLSGISTYIQGPCLEHKPAFMISLDTVMSRMSSDGVDRSIRKHVTPFTTNLLIFTSGTTGLPKPAIVDHARSLMVGYSFSLFGMTSDDIVYTTLPLYHSAGLLLGFHAVILHGGAMLLRDKFLASHFWEECRHHKVTVIQYIGELCRYLLAQPPSKLDGQHSVRVAYGNGLRKDIWQEFQTRFNIPRIMEFYGATEAPIGFVNITNKLGACGRSSPIQRKTQAPVAFIQYDHLSQSPVRNKEGWCIATGTEEVGLLIVELIENRTSFRGYKGRKQDTEKKMLFDVFRKGDKYFNTGDLMYVDKEYYLYFSDRVGDTFRWKGENVSTTEVSNVLTDLSFIHDANVYGVSIPGYEGRAGMVALHLNPAGCLELSPAKLTQLSDHVRASLPAYARPRFIRIQGQFDMTSTFKQQKMNLVKEGFDISKISDQVYYLHPPTQSYLTLDEHAFNQIMAGKVAL